MSATLSPREYAEWIAYYQLEPWGCEAEDIRWRQHYSLTYAFNTKAGSKEPDWLDRDPEETARKRAAVSKEQQIESFFAGMATHAPEDTPKDFAIDPVTGEIILVDRAPPEPPETVEFID